MIILNRDVVSDIASKVLGRRVEVVIEVDPDRGVGHAWQSSSGDWFISVSPFQRPESQLFVWAHELAHLAFGHVKKPRHETSSFETIAARVEPEVEELLRESHKKNEADCDNFAQTVLDSIPEEAWPTLFVERN